MKLGKNAKNRLKFRHKKIFKKQGNQLKRGTLTPLQITLNANN